ncbi:MAG: SUMF1/EgtB/PvdO family nonheme iron enzyme [Polyangiaceae bacterium]
MRLVALGCLLLASACTHDFTGYHLESVEGAGAGGNAGSGGMADNGRAGHSGQFAGDAGASAEAGSASVSGAANAGSAGSPDEDPTIMPPSCLNLPDTCGPASDASCCAASTVPGGSYNRSNQASAAATVSAFLLDDYEVTVGRFRAFIAAYSQNMTALGSGKNAHDRGANPGWNSLWNARLPASPAALSSALQCPSGTFTAAAGSNENKPVTCVDWYEAYAFCIWDGGRLPTEAEWNFAAAGGSEERAYPWGAPVPDDTRAVFCPGSCSVLLAVGPKAPTGNGKWGQADLVGNAWEWNLDVYLNPYPKAACNDCANTPADSTDPRVFRGGSAGNEASFLLAATRYSRAAGDHNGFVGLRCARDL